MRYRLVAEVDGEIYIPEPISVERDKALFEFLSNKSGKMSEVAVSVQVSPARIPNFVSKIGPGDSQAQLTLTIGADSEIRERLVAELQLLESELAFASRGSLKRIAWSNPRQEFIPESPEEKTSIDKISMRRNWAYPSLQCSVTANELRDLVTSAQRYSVLQIVKAFWREGKNNFRNFQYIQAFYDFYFVIEDLFAQGKPKKSGVLKAFAESTDFTSICEDSLKTVFEDDHHRTNLEKLFKMEKCSTDTVGLQKLLFLTRGSLHHYYSKSPKNRGTPFNQKEFESIAFLTMLIATTAILYQVVKINKKPRTG